MAGRDPGDGAPDNPAEDVRGFLGRWSRRKAEARNAADPKASAAGTADVSVDDRTGDKTAALAPSVATGDGTAPLATTAEAPAFDIDSLPDIDSLGSTSDFSVFMQAGVPPALKTRALRKLWRVKPELANLDGLLDYGEDLTGSFKVVDHLKTAYQVGRGFLRQKDDREPEAPPAGDDGAAIASEDSDAPAVLAAAEKAPETESAPETAAADGEQPAEAQQVEKPPG